MVVFKIRIPIWMYLLPLAIACAPLHAGGDAPEYDADSWQSSIADDCRSFFDGCNNCRREPGKAAACTRMACAVYQQPRCLDEQSPATRNGGPSNAKLVSYWCAAGQSFSVAYHEFVEDAQVVRLEPDQVLLRDAQTGQSHLLEREPSASGERYVGASGLRLASKGDNALLMQDDQRLYADCRIES